MLSIGRYPLSLSLWREAREYYDVGVRVTSYNVSVTLWKLNIAIKINIVGKLRGR